MKELFLNFLNMSVTAGCIVLALAIGGIGMEELFLNFLNMSITAGWIVLVLVLLRPLLKKAPKWITCAMWGLVALRLVLPISVESAISLIPSAETVPPEAIYQTEPQIDSGITVLNSAVNPILSEHFSASGFENETMLGPKVLPLACGGGSNAPLYAFQLPCFKNPSEGGGKGRGGMLSLRPRGKSLYFRHREPPHLSAHRTFKRGQEARSCPRASAFEEKGSSHQALCLLFAVVLLVQPPFVACLSPALQGY